MEPILVLAHTEEDGTLGKPALEALAVEFHLHDRRLASDDKRLCLTVSISLSIPKNQAN